MMPKMAATTSWSFESGGIRIRTRYLGRVAPSDPIRQFTSSPFEYQVVVQAPAGRFIFREFEPRPLDGSLAPSLDLIRVTQNAWIDLILAGRDPEAYLAEEMAWWGMPENPLDIETREERIRLAQDTIKFAEGLGRAAIEKVDDELEESFEAEYKNLFPNAGKD